MLPPGSATESRLCRGTQQPGRCLQRARQSGRSHRLLPPGPRSQTRFCRGPLQPGRGRQRPRKTGRSHRLLPPGPGTESGLCRGTDQPGRGVRRPGESGRSGRLLPPHTGPQAGLRRGPLESIAIVAADRGFPARLGRLPVALESQDLPAARLFAAPLGRAAAGGKVDPPPCRARAGRHDPVHPLRDSGQESWSEGARGMSEAAGSALGRLSRRRCVDRPRGRTAALRTSRPRC